MFTHFQVVCYSFVQLCLYSVYFGAFLPCINLALILPILFYTALNTKVGVVMEVGDQHLAAVVAALEGLPVSIIGRTTVAKQAKFTFNGEVVRKQLQCGRTSGDEPWLLFPSCTFFFFFDLSPQRC